MNIDDYIAENSSAEPAVLLELFRQTHLRTLQPRMLSGHVEGRLLSLLTSIIAPSRVLELGTFTGYSTICMALSMAEGTELHTVDINDELDSISNEFFAKAGVQNIVRRHLGAALEVLGTFDAPFDMIFMDADKREYLQYYKMLFQYDLLHSGSVIVADNTLWDGKVLREIKDNDKQTLGIQHFNEFVASDERVEKVILPIRDGITIIRVK